MFVEISEPDEDGDIVVRLVGKEHWHLAMHGRTLSEALGRLADIIRMVEQEEKKEN